MTCPICHKSLYRCEETYQNYVHELEQENKRLKEIEDRLQLRIAQIKQIPKSNNEFIIDHFKMELEILELIHDGTTSKEK